MDEINTLEKKPETIKFIKGDALQEGLDQPMKIKGWYVYIDKLLSLRNPNNNMTYGEASALITRVMDVIE